MGKRKKSFLIFHPARVLVLSFALTILIGSFLLMLPLATVGGSMRFIDALFTSASAVCVTGLTVVDTGTYFTEFGQVTIMALIQVGGLGIITLSTFFIWSMGKKISFRDRKIITGSFAPTPEKEFRSLLRGVVFLTFVIEGSGALILWLRWMDLYSPGKSLYFAVFHSVSAFCNAGFALFPDNLCAFKDDLTVNLVITSLIILGGLGFFVLMELTDYFKNRGNNANFRKISLHTKITLTATAVLILGGTFFVFIFEKENVLQGLPLKSKLLISYFQAVTPRTAGFNTVDMAMLANPTLFLMLLLMFVGASPGSTGGGIKTTSLGVLTAVVISKFRGSDVAVCFKRTIPSQTVLRVVSLIVVSSLAVVFITMALCITEAGWLSHKASRGFFLEILFETISAFGTVGLSMGITAGLTPLGKLIITLMMFIGRVGPLSVAVVMGQKEHFARYSYPEEELMAG
jgi:trk system potassium uptake protein TrkH